MKNLNLALLLLLVSNVLLAQQINESIINFKEIYDPVLSSEKAVISMDFVKLYTVDLQDTSYLFTIKVANETIQKESVSLGSAIFSGGSWGVGRNANYSVNSTENQTTLNKEDFASFYECINKTFTFITQKETFSKSKNNFVATCGSGSLLVGGEYNPENKAQKSTFYFQLGQNTYSMSKNQFQKIVSTLRNIFSTWKSVE